MTNPCPIDTAALRRFAETLTGVRSGWPTDGDRERLPHVVRLDDLSRAVLGDGRFARVFTRCRAAAVHLAGLDLLIEPIYDDRWERTGYEFRFADGATAARFAAAHRAALEDLSSPLVRGAA